MTKLWTSNVSGDDKIIAFMNNTIYKCNPKKEDVDPSLQAFRSNAIPSKGTFGIPVSYIREFILQEGKKKIRIVLGTGSEDELTITDNKMREEIFESFKLIVPAYSIITEKVTRWKAGRKPLIALAVVILLFCWTMLNAATLESANEFEVSGTGLNTGSIVLVLATLGMQKVIFIFCCLMAIAILAFIRKTKTPPVYKRIIIRRG